MKGDPLRGVHAFYSASEREWWAPLRPGHRVARRNALVGVLDKTSDFAGRAIHEWTGQVFRDDSGTILSGQYRLMIRTERSKARKRAKHAAIELTPYTDEQIAEIDEQYASEGVRGAEPRWWEDVEVGDTVGPMVKGPLTVTDIVCWHVGMGMGLYGVKPLRLGRPQPGPHPAVLPSRRLDPPEPASSRGCWVAVTREWLDQQERPLRKSVQLRGGDHPFEHFSQYHRQSPAAGGIDRIGDGGAGIAIEASRFATHMTRSPGHLIPSTATMGSPIGLRFWSQGCRTLSAIPEVFDLLGGNHAALDNSELHSVFPQK